MGQKFLNVFESQYKFFEDKGTNFKFVFNLTSLRLLSFSIFLLLVSTQQRNLKAFSRRRGDINVTFTVEVARKNRFCQMSLSLLSLASFCEHFLFKIGFDCVSVTVLNH